ncbi:MAG: TonB-dependent hemoglobin/transferrin/lactoferrin family receptor [Pseudohongiellaceae bacterium]
MFVNSAHRRLWLLVVPVISPFAGIHAAEESLIEPEELVITATRLPRSIEDIAGTITVITDDDIAHHLAEDMDDLTRFEPGITMNTANRGGNQGFVIRGMGGNRVLTVLDGIRSNDIYMAGPSSYGKDAFEVDDLKAVEIIRGPASVLYGADAMGGAVILRSKDPADYLAPEDDSYLALRSAATSANGQYKLGVTVAGRLGDIGSLVQVTHREFHETDINGSSSNPQEGKSNGLLLKNVWDMAKAHQLRATADVLQEEIDTRLDSDLSPGVSESIGFDETERMRFSLVYQWQADAALFDDMDMDLSWQRTDALQHTEQYLTSYSFLNPMNPATYGGTEAFRDTDFEFNQDTLSAGINLRKSLNLSSMGHTFAYGLHRDRTETVRPRNRCDEQLTTGEVTCSIASYPFAPSENFPNKTFPDSTTTRTGVYIQDEIVPGDSRLTLVPGIRYDHYDMEPHVDALLDGSGYIETYGGYAVTAVDEHAVSFSLGALYELSDQVSLFAQYAEGFRPPNFDESNQAFVNLGHGYATVPNPALESESSEGLELGIRANVKNALISLAVYDNRYQDFIESASIGTEGNISLFQDQNVGRARIRGVELTSMWYPGDSWQVRTSLAYSRGNNEEAGVPLDSVEPLTGVIGLRYDEASGDWGFETMLTAVAKKDRVSADDRATADAYTVVDIVGHYRVTRSSTVRAGLFNVFDENYARWTNIQGLAAGDTDNIARAQAAGTNFRLSLDYKF